MNLINVNHLKADFIAIVKIVENQQRKSGEIRIRNKLKKNKKEIIKNYSHI
jgi:hypothetical protein